MKLVIIDGQGGRLGSLLVEAIKKESLHVEPLVIGTNAIATAAMLKAGAAQSAAGENPVLVACRDADLIVGAIGILAADALRGESTPKMAVGVGQSKALELLLPMGRCNNQVIGVEYATISELFKETVARHKTLL